MARTGRPRGFNRDAALAGALNAFWRHGYQAASLERLREAMGGLSAASFYAAFGSKEALYREALARYVATHGRVLDALRDERLAPRERIERALRSSVRMQTDPSHPAGCLVALSALPGGADDNALNALTAAERAANRAAIAACVRAGIEGGELRPETNPTGLATLLEALLLGVSTQIIDGVPARALDGAITAALVAWDSARSHQSV
ncbi:TetR/AcrR family transcriptional regulator [Sphingomonas sp.]|uniref:TetR/AcrR family transcriptional regulator n=1 Tax=Sphingomonas sp. TaxID=28214 RepID=UPI003B000729